MPLTWLTWLTYAAPVTHRLPRALAGTAAAVLLLPLAGCGGDGGGDPEEPSAGSERSQPDEPQPEDSASPEGDAEGADDADELELEGAGWSFDAPAGWEDGRGELGPENPQVKAVAFDPEPAEVAFRDNVNLVVNPDAPELGPGQVEQQIEKELGGLTESTAVEDRTEIGGRGAVHVSGTATAGDVPVLLDQYAAYSADGVIHILTFTQAEATPADERQAHVDAVLSSWEWEDRA